MTEVTTDEILSTLESDIVVFSGSKEQIDLKSDDLVAYALIFLPLTITFKFNINYNKNFI
ncbi:hypothetical protein [Simkania sp.]|uniref:hypothetical protein n=1 Tax=Simkania sp. TaxID=34094 RepID=UPI003B51B68B